MILQTHIKEYNISITFFLSTEHMKIEQTAPVLLYLMHIIKYKGHYLLIVN